MKQSKFFTTEWGKTAQELLPQVNRNVDGELMTYARVSRIIETKHRVKVPERTLRYYKEKFIDPEEILPPETTRKELERRRAKIDIMAERAVLFRAQQKRLKIDMKIERDMNKLLGTTHKEIETANIILNDLKSDYFEMGVIPKVPEKFEHMTDLNVNFVEALRKVREMKEKEKIESGRTTA